MSTPRNQSAEVLRLLGSIAAAIVLGIALCFPLFNYLPFVWGAGLALVFVAYGLVCGAKARPTTAGSYLRTGAIYSLVFVVAAVAILSTFSGVERIEQYQCGWKVDGDVVEIGLKPIGGFGPARIKSARLAEHLTNDAPTRVPVTLSITRDFGKIRSRGEIQSVDGIAVEE